MFKLYFGFEFKFISPYLYMYNWLHRGDQAQALADFGTTAGDEAKLFSAPRAHVKEHLLVVQTL